MSSHPNDAQELLPKVVFLGRSGAGKSSLINGLLEQDVCKVSRFGELHTTQEKTEHSSNQSNEYPSILLMDLPGFGVANQWGEITSEEAKESMLLELMTADLGVLVLPYPTQNIEIEIDFLQRFFAKIQEDFARRHRYQEPHHRFPILFVLNQIDKVEPIEEWNPNELDLLHPTTQKEKNILEWKAHIEHQLELCDFSESLQFFFFPCCAGETIGEKTLKEERYGLRELNEGIEKALPQNKSFLWTAYSKKWEDVQSKAQKIIWGTSVAAATAAMVPVPLSDAFLITPLQVGMIVSLASLYGTHLSWRKAMGLIAPLLGVIGGRLLVSSLLKLIPGAGSVISAGIAGLFTLALGQTYHFFFLRGDFSPTAQSVLEQFKKFYQKAQSSKDEILEQAKQNKTK